MVKLYGKKWARRELESRVGRIEQLGGVQAFVMREGPEDGQAVFRVRTGSGLSYWVHPGKGMDISLAEFGGIPVSWSASNGAPHPSFFREEGDAWLRTASGGLLMTCGLSQVGAAGEDEYGAYSLHGQIHHMPARQVSCLAEWQGDEYEMRIRGVLDETSIFGHVLRLTRTIISRLGENSLKIIDIVENLSFKPVPHMLLYHFNFGFPLLAEDTRIVLPASNCTPRDTDMDMSSLTEWQAPDPLFKEQVYYHEPIEQQKNVVAQIISPSFPLHGANSSGNGLTVELKWNPETLPRLVQWRMPGAGEHVLGLEPSNCWTKGRAEERKAKTLRMLEPGEAIRYELELNFKID
ncbi:aldose 1-epimerase family protein [Paenibacillus sanguinis]|uniref:aldose 1-epimerase family protein n=1 Tax=Paenibacillus sanguinis TaxID=225906 RepID=UPI00035C6C03|nr:aldose 1-epimerase family protein [Paenibacillus sanguinis]